MHCAASRSCAQRAASVRECVSNAVATGVANDHSDSRPARVHVALGSRATQHAIRLDRKWESGVDPSSARVLWRRKRTLDGALR
jgi:hypothetical protein